MAELHVRQIQAAIEKATDGLIDLSDVTGRPDQEVTNAALTRGLAAYVLSYLAGIDAADACKAVTDGGQDNGLDAVFYHPADRILYVVQSKWHHSGNGSLALGDAEKFLKGVRDLVNARWDRFGPKVQAHRPTVDAALTETATRTVLVVTYTGQDPLAQEAADALNDFVRENNEPTELFSLQVLRQGDVYSAVASGLSGTPIDLEVLLYEWGQKQEPYEAIYGQITAADLAKWYQDHSIRLFAPNIRMFLGSTEANVAITETLHGSPGNFWYFNNGVTALCRTFKKKLIGGNTRESGTFSCEDLRIVNGAQTVGSIAAAASDSAAEVEQARVPIRIIALEHCPPEFDKLITRYNNTQNRIDRRDFVALDPEQERLRAELQLDGVTYAYKSGEPLTTRKQAFDLAEATVARACQAASESHAVQAKREIGLLWEDIERAPYLTLFNPGLTGPALWSSVNVVRTVEDALLQHRSDEGRRALLAIHGNRFIAHLVFRTMSPDMVPSLDGTDAAPQAALEAHVHDVFERLFKLVEDDFAGAYLANLFKNLSKCQQLKASFTGQQLPLST